MATLTYSPLSFKPTQQYSSPGSLSLATSSKRSALSAPRPQASAPSSQPPAKYTNNTLSTQTVNKSTSNQSAFPSQSQRGPATPPTAPSGALTPKRDSPGSWKHPRAQEIAQRQRASTFGPDNVATIIRCIIALSGVEILRWTL